MTVTADVAVNVTRAIRAASDSLPPELYVVVVVGMPLKDTDEHEMSAAAMVGCDGADPLGMAADYLATIVAAADAGLPYTAADPRIEAT